LAVHDVGELNVFSRARITSACLLLDRNLSRRYLMGNYYVFERRKLFIYAYRGESIFVTQLHIIHARSSGFVAQD